MLLCSPARGQGAIIDGGAWDKAPQNNAKPIARMLSGSVRADGGATAVAAEEEQDNDPPREGQEWGKRVGLARAADKDAFVFGAKGQGIRGGRSAAGIGDLELEGVGAFGFDEEGEGW